ncbi:MAG TPA: FMN-binding protein [Gemmatimonadales bacterium]
MLTLHRLPRPYRVLYVGIALLLTVALLSHWWRLALRHGVTPRALVAWYVGDPEVMLFRKTGVEVAEDAWMNLFHHTLAFLVLGGLLVRTDAAPRTKAISGALFGGGTVISAAGPALVWWGVPGAASLYAGGLALLSGLGVLVLGLVARDAVARRAKGHRGTAGSDVLARVLPVLMILGLASPAAAQAGVYLTERQAILEVFPVARWVATDTIRPDSATRADLEHSLGRPLVEWEFIVRRLYLDPDSSPPGATHNAQRLLGYSLVTDERGKYRPITMLVGVDASFRVVGVRILVYREPRGGEVARQYFLRQYRGKQVGDPIRLNRDVINISGATISVNSVNAGVRKTLALIERYYRTARAPDTRHLARLSELP